MWLRVCIFNQTVSSPTEEELVGGHGRYYNDVYPSKGPHYIKRAVVYLWC